MKWIMMLGLIFSLNLFSREQLQLNFIIEPKFKAIDSIAPIIHEHTHNDSIVYFNIFSGQILEKKATDEEVIQFLNQMDCHFAAPTAFHFSPAFKESNFTILASNLENQLLKPYEIIETDSMKIGIITFYSPDHFVKTSLDSETKFDYNFFHSVAKLVNELSKKVDYIILLSGLSKEIDEDMVKNIPVDVVISFDYQSRQNGLLLNKKTYWYSIKTHRGIIGTLKLNYDLGKIDHVWSEKRVPFQ